MARLFLILVACAAVAPHFSEAACDATKYTEDATKCTKAVTKCATDAGSDICAVAKCSVTALDCSNTASSDAGCCDDMKAAFDASKKAWDDSMKANEAVYKDCKKEDLEWSGTCGGGGDADGAVSAVQVSAMALIAAMTAFTM